MVASLEIEQEGMLDDRIGWAMSLEHDESTRAADPEHVPELTIALSGGGHRASLFASACFSHWSTSS